MRYDVVIVGAGPSALVAASRILEYNPKKNLIIIEQGESFETRDRDDPSMVSSGFGGAGLFTDGKISLPPSATYLWTKLDKRNVMVSYENVNKWLKEYEVTLPKIEETWFDSHEIYNCQKYYDSYKLTTEQSEAIIKDFESKIKNNLCLKARVDKIKKNLKNGYIIESGDKIYEAKKIIIATGKESYVNLFSGFNIKINYVSEIGVRISVPNAYFLPYQSDQLDYKLIVKNDEYEIRTFCCCKDGEIVKSKFGKFYSFNGMITDTKTGFSNIGILIRGKNKELSDNLINAITQLNKSYGEIPLKRFLNGERLFGIKYDNMIREFINRLVDIDSLPEQEASLYFPCIEKTGEFFDEFSDGSLKLKSENIWIIGDATYKFRGLLAAFVSGEFAANEICKTQTLIPIKKSSIEKTKIVFTAQSKEFYYCKDVICAYVFKQGATPINPFQVFNYFLNDRVDRSIVRRGNNNLILRSDELWVFGKISDGVLFEIKLAKENNIAIRYFSLGTFVRDIKEISINEVKFDPEIHAKQITKDDLYAFLKDNLPEEKIKQLNIFDDI